MVVRVADETLVLPLTAIVETLKPQPDAVHPMGDEAQVAFVRGEFLPIVDVGCELGFRMEPVGVDACVFILIETEDGYRCALAVDSIHDQRQVVIKGLEENYGEVPGVAAATILGDGRIALILDPDNLTESRRAARMVA